MSLTQGGQRIKVIMSDHEYLALHRLLEKGVFDIWLTTWQNFGIGALDNTKLVIPASEVQVIKLDEKPLSVVRQIAIPNDGPAVLVLSHVSRIDGRMVNFQGVYEELKLLNERRSEPNKIYLVVDGSQAVGTFEFKAEGSCDAYLGSSSKAIGAEPTLGFAYVSDELLKIITANVFRAGYPKVSFQFSPEIISSAGSTFSISLPELASLKFSLEKLLKIGTKEVERRLRELGERLRRKLPKAKLLETGFPTSPYMLFLEVTNPIRIAEKLSSIGIQVGHNQFWSIVQHPPAIRVSWNVETPTGHIDKFAEGFSEIGRCRYEDIS